MRKIWISAMMAFLFLLSQSGKGQIIIDKNDMPSKGDTVRVSTGLNADFIDVSETGAGYVWDYSGLIPITQRIDTFRSVWDTPAGLLFAMTSDFATRMAETLPFPGIEITNTFQYFKSRSDEYKNTGFAFSLQGFPIPANFSSHDILYKFPLEYGNSDSSSSGVDMDIPTVGYIKIDRHRKNSVDGWGTLTTPYGTFDVLRVKSEVSEYDSVYLDSQEMGFGIPYSYTEYKWLSKNQIIPVLTVRDIAGGIIVEYPDSIRRILGVGENKDIISKLMLYPNPVSSKEFISFTLQKTDNISIAISDINGKIIYRSEPKRFNKGTNLISLDMEKHHLKKGNYFISLIANNRTITRKIIYLPK